MAYPPMQPAPLEKDPIGTETNTSDVNGLGPSNALVRCRTDAEKRSLQHTLDIVCAPCGQVNAGRVGTTHQKNKKR